MNKPNIIMILVDDMGFSDIGCYGGEVRTPVLDRLAGGGMRFTDFYCTPRCCPTRASLLTGLTPHKAGVGWMSFDWRRCDPTADGYTGTLNRNCITIAEALKPTGYRTYLSGKWHVTSQLDDKNTWPTARGFDRSFSMISGATSYFEPEHLTLDDKFYRAPNEIYLTDLIGRYSARFIDEHHRGHGDEPFFMYVPYTAPHFPLEAPDDVAAKYLETYSRGWDRLRQERYLRMIEMGIIRPEWKLPPRPDTVPAWDTLSEKEKKRQSKNMALYAAMIEIMDKNIGVLVESLERNGALDNTLIMFMSDNGACAEGPVMGSDSHYGECWAHLSNTPFRLYKHFTCQGGVQTPFIAHWPARIPAAESGTMSDWTGSLYDIMPTCLDVGDAQYPAQFNGEKLQPLDGVSLVPVLAGGEPEHRPDIFMEHEGNQMVRSGRYKLVRQHDDELWQLYNMEDDRTELIDIAMREPELFVDLAARYARWEQQAAIIPWPQAGKYMDYHGYSNWGDEYELAFTRAMDKADPADIVNGADLGD
jgi:arylsulfatase A-like enzyme